MHRKVTRNPPETMFDYFSGGEWEMTAIYILFTYHFFTVLPEFIIAAAYL